MPQNLLIVESPNKIKKIKSFLGNNWDVKASVGHISDLAIKEGVDGLGIEDYESFKPIYKVLSDKKKVVSNLKDAVKKVQNIYLATDPDREGEAISNHLKLILGLKDYYRVTFNEISENAIKKALNEPGKINQNLVEAQEARRIIDRLYGFLGSKVIQQSSEGKMKSVGRVQSAGLKLIVDREKEIQSFKPVKYQEPQIIINDLVFKIKLKNEEIIKTNWKEVTFNKETDVQDIKTFDKKVNPPKPLTTNDALKLGARFNFSPKETTKLLQKLFENGLVTYIRSDSNNVSNEFKVEAKNFIQNNYSINPDITRVYKTKENAQEGHEAIRPVHITENGNDIENENEKNLYKAIYKVSLASQMESGIDTIQEISIHINNYEFVNSSKVIKQKGFREYFSNDEEDYQTSEINKGTHNLTLELKDKVTKPPTRFSETSFLDKLEKSGIGRPSTFATILETILVREYAAKQKKKQNILFPSDIGIKLIEFLESNFTDIIKIDFTRELENDLDLITQGSKSKKIVISNFYKILDKYINDSRKTIEINLASQNGTCPKCGKYLRKLEFKSGKALGCSRYPQCKYIKFLNEKPKTNPNARFNKLMRKGAN